MIKITNSTTNQQKNHKGKFISFEGIEGCGKSTQAKMLAEYLESKDVQVTLTREIGGVNTAESIRDIVVNQDLLPMSELMLVMAARYEHLQKLILPKLEEGNVVICDRFVDSTACYQGLSQDIGVEKVYQLHHQLIGNILPCITLFIDVDPQEALNRATNRGNTNKFEAKNLEFHQQVAQGFQALVGKFQQRIVKIEANTLTQIEVHQKILKFLHF
jgi:dTMP kinase